VFGDPDRVATAERQLESLRPKNQDFATYDIKFERNISDVE
jgi:hypothetical protein